MGNREIRAMVADIQEMNMEIQVTIREIQVMTILVQIQRVDTIGRVVVIIQVETMGMGQEGGRVTVSRDLVREIMLVMMLEHMKGPVIQKAHQWMAVKEVEGLEIQIVVSRGKVLSKAQTRQKKASLAKQTRHLKADKKKAREENPPKVKKASESNDSSNSPTKENSTPGKESAKDQSTVPVKDSGPVDVAIGGVNGNGCPWFNAWIDSGGDPSAYVGRKDKGRYERGDNSKHEMKRKRKEDRMYGAFERSRGGGGVGAWHQYNDEDNANRRGGENNNEWTLVESNGKMSKKEKERQEEQLARERAEQAERDERSGFGSYGNTNKYDGYNHRNRYDDLDDDDDDDYDDDYDEYSGRYSKSQFNTYQPATHLGFMKFVDKGNLALLSNRSMQNQGYALHEIHTFAQHTAKEIYFLTAALGQIMATFSVLEEGGWATFKIHGGQTEESRCLAKIIRPFFEECEIYPVSKAYTCHMLVAGKGFKKHTVEGKALVSLLETCSSLNTSSLNHVCSLIKNEYIITEKEFENFEQRVELTSQKMFMDWFDHNVAISKASIQAPLEGEVEPYAGYLIPEVGRLLNKLVFRHVSQDDLTRNRKTLQTIMETPFGAQLQPLFVFAGPPPTSLIMPKSSSDRKTQKNHHAGDTHSHNLVYFKPELIS